MLTITHHIPTKRRCSCNHLAESTAFDASSKTCRPCLRKKKEKYAAKTGTAKYMAQVQAMQAIVKARNVQIAAATAADVITERLSARSSTTSSHGII